MALSVTYFHMKCVTDSATEIFHRGVSLDKQTSQEHTVNREGFAVMDTSLTHFRCVDYLLCM